MEERLFSVNKEGVRHPDLGQEGPVESQLVQTLGVVAQSLVLPALSEVAVQGVDLAHLVHRAHRPDVQVDVHHHGGVRLGDREDSPVVAGLEQEVVQGLGGLFTQGVPRSDIANICSLGQGGMEGYLPVERSPVTFSKHLFSSGRIVCQHDQRDINI